MLLRPSHKPAASSLRMIASQLHRQRVLSRDEDLSRVDGLDEEVCETGRLESLLNLTYSI